jgi:hypothetical protein
VLRARGVRAWARASVEYTSFRVAPARALRRTARRDCLTCTAAEPRGGDDQRCRPPDASVTRARHRA